MKANDESSLDSQCQNQGSREARIWFWTGALLFFTAILLVTIAPLAEKRRNRQSSLWAVQKTMVELQNAILNFRAEYGRWPVERTENHPSDTGFVVHLLGQEKRINKRGIGFLKDLPKARGKPPIHGLSREGESGEVLDLWGRPFLILLDQDKDGFISNPEASVGGADSRLRLAVGILSAGADGVFAGKNREGKDATKDNLRSW